MNSKTELENQSSQALKLLNKENTPVEVAIKLEIETDGVERFYRGYWNLKGLYILRQVYAKIKGSVSSFVKLPSINKITTTMDLITCIPDIIYYRLLAISCLLFGFGWEDDDDDDDIIAVNAVIYKELVYFLVVFLSVPSYL